MVAVLYAMLLGTFIYRRLGIRDLREIPNVPLADAFAAISLFCIGTASAFGWLLAYFHIPQLFVDMVSGLGRRHYQRGLHHRLLFPGDRLLHRCHSGDHHRRHHTLASGGKCRHAPDSFCDHRCYLDCVWPGDAALWAVPDDCLHYRRHQDQGGDQGHADTFHSHDSRAGVRDPCAGRDAVAAAHAHAQLGQMRLGGAQPDVFARRRAAGLLTATAKFGQI